MILFLWSLSLNSEQWLPWARIDWKEGCGWAREFWGEGAGKNVLCLDLGDGNTDVDNCQNSSDLRPTCFTINFYISIKKKERILDKYYSKRPKKKKKDKPHTIPRILQKGIPGSPPPSPTPSAPASPSPNNLCRPAVKSKEGSAILRPCWGSPSARLLFPCTAFSDRGGGPWEPHKNLSLGQEGWAKVVTFVKMIPPKFIS